MRRVAILSFAGLAGLSGGCRGDLSSGSSGTGTETDAGSTSTTETSSTTGSTGGTGTSQGTDSASSSTTATSSTTGSTTATTGDPTAVPAGAVVLYDDVCPAGTTEVFGAQNRFARGHDGDGDFAEDGGSADHTHTVDPHAHATAMADGSHMHTVSFQAAPESQNDGSFGGNTYNVADAAHGHDNVFTDPAGTVHDHELPSEPAIEVTGPNDPPWREVVFCAVDRGLPAIPVGGMVLAADTCGDGYVAVEAFAGKILRGHDGDATFDEEGGNADHTHSFDHDHDGVTSYADPHQHTGNTGPGTNNYLMTQGNVYDVALVDHTHPISTNAVSHNHGVTETGAESTVGTAMPEYRETAVCEAADAPGPVASGLRLLFTRACPAGWAELTEYRNRFLRGDDGNGTSEEDGGTIDHDHDMIHDHGDTASAEHSHDGFVGWPNSTGQIAANGAAQTVSTTQHEHAVNVQSGGGHAHAVMSSIPGSTQADHTPEYHEFVVCELQ